MIKLDETEAKQIIKLTKSVLLLTLIVQPFLLYGLFLGTKLIAEAKNEVYGFGDFLLSPEVIIFVVITFSVLLFFYIRNFLYAIFLAALFFLGFLNGLVAKLGDGFQATDLSATSLTGLANSLLLAMSAYSLYILKKNSDV